MKKLLLVLLFIPFVSCSGEDEENTIPTNNVSQTPEPETVQYTLTLTATDGGSVSGGGTFDKGTEVTFTATPNEGYRFTGWEGSSSTELSQTITLDSNQTYEALFELITYTLTVTAGEGGTVSSEGGTYESGENTDYDSGTIIKLTAVPSEGWVFLDFTGTYQTYQDTLTITVEENISLTARFFQSDNCLNGDNDVFNGLQWKTVNELGNKPYNCLVVNKLDGHPVFDGEESARFELRPESGDCGYTEGGFSDCDTNRSRHEIYEKWTAEGADIKDKIITYEYSMYIPKVEYFSPTSSENGKPFTVLSQVFSQSEGENQLTGDGNSSQCDAKALNYFVMNGNQFQYLTHRPFTWLQNERIIISDNPFDIWFKIKIEIYSTTSDEGYIKLFVNDVLINEDLNRPTICSTENQNITLKLGIYNSYIEYKTKPFMKQVVYYDNVRKTISNTLN